MSSLGWSIAKKLLFKLDPENAHGLARAGLSTLRHLPGAIPALSGGAVRTPWRIDGWQLEFMNRVGLAAGFDKNADWLPYLPRLGFGFAEIGTVTPRPQGGNPRPRLFRNVEERSLFNCMGFNNLGAEVVSRRVAGLRDRGSLPNNFRIGVNIGKNRTTEQEQAPEDFVAAVRPFEDKVDFVVINVSSPNTPGLRALQARELLAPLAGRVIQEVARWKRSVPVAVKLSPELRSTLNGTELAELFAVLEREGVRGWILTNTLSGERLEGQKRIIGGISGAPLTEGSREFLERVRREKWTLQPVISVGGIMNVDEARARLDLGADLIEIYTGWIFEGRDLRTV